MPENTVVAMREAEKYFPYSSSFYIQRQSFWAAGQDSFTSPPAQNSDLFAALTNTEPVLTGVIRRRRGYTLYSSQAPSTPYTLGYSFRSEVLGFHRVVYTSTANVLALNEDGTNFIANLFTPAVGASRPRMVLSRSYGYFMDGITTDSRKWDGTSTTGNLTNWGIASFGTAAAKSGPSTPTTTTNNTFYIGDNWTITSQTAPTASVTLAADGDFARPLSIEGFGFSMGSGLAVTGIEVAITGQTSSTAGYLGSTLIWKAQLLSGGNTISNPKVANMPIGSSTVVLGSITDTWGTSLTPAQVNASNFGVLVYTSAGLAGETFNLTGVTITLWTNTGTITVTPGGASSGAINLLSGRTYFAAFQNATTGTVSGLNSASVTSGPLTNQNVVLTAIPVSTDTQVTNTLILATADGNDQTKLYLLTSLAAGTTTYTDNTTDTILLTQPVYQETQADGTLHGIANNNPPPVGKFPTKHKGRIYMVSAASPNALVFSKNLTEVTTSTGTITTKWEEAWPATNQIDVSEFAETIQGLLSDGETLWIGTERCIRRLVGDSPSNFQDPEIQFNEAGLLNQDVCKIVYAESQPVGAMWMTPDFKVMFSDFNTYSNVGTPIQDVLNGITTTAVSTVHACFVTQGAANWYMLYIPTGGASTPNTVCVFNLGTKTWSIWSPTDLVNASLFFFDANGTPKWTFSTALGSLYFWDSTVLQDRVNNTPQSYAVTITTSWLDFGDSVLRKSMQQLITGTDDGTLTVTIRAANTDADFLLGGITILPTTAVKPGPLGDLFVPLASAVTKYRWYKFILQSPPSTVQDVLVNYSIEATPILRL